MSEGCPTCGFPSTRDGRHFKGIYTQGKPCPLCGFKDTSGIRLDDLIEEKLEKPEDRVRLAGYMASYLHGSLHRYPSQERPWIQRTIKILRSFSRGT